jgi:signal transduction histidine kinase/PAS domain-containing protein
MGHRSASLTGSHVPAANPELLTGGPSLVLASIPADSILHAVLAAVTDSMLVFDRRGRMLTGSLAAARAVGLSLRELPGAGVADLSLPDELRTSLASGLAAVLESGASREGVCPAVPGNRASGLAFHLAPVRGPGGEILGAVCRLERAAARSGGEETFRALADSLDDAVFTLDRNLRQTGVHARRAETEARSSAAALEDLAGDSRGSRASVVDEEAARRALAGDRVVYDWELETKHGRRFRQTSLVPVRGEDGSVTGIVGVERDMTDRRREQEELSRLLSWSSTVKAEWKATVDSLPEFVALVDFVGCVVCGNRMLEDWGLRGPGEVSGLDLHELLHPGCSGTSCYFTEALGRAWDATLEGRDVAVESEDPHLRRFVRATFRPVVRSDAQHAIPTMLVVVEDRSVARRVQHDRDRMEMRLRGSQKQEALAQLAGGMAHELNAPAQLIGDSLRFLREGAGEVASALRRIQSALVLAGEGRLSAAEARALTEELRSSDLETLVREMPATATHSIEGIERVSAIIRAMKEFSESGPDQRVPVDIRHAVRNALVVTRHRWEPVAETSTEFDPALPDVGCDPADLNQVLFHLLVNAADAVAEARRSDPDRPGRIRVSVRREHDQAVLRVIDNGCGIREENRPRLFEPFFTTKPVSEGTGQGLPYCHTIVVKKHHGRIDFESEVGVGSTFIVRLPL